MHYDHHIIKVLFLFFIFIIGAHHTFFTRSDNIRRYKWGVFLIRAYVDHETEVLCIHSVLKLWGGQYLQLILRVKKGVRI